MGSRAPREGVVIERFRRRGDLCGLSGRVWREPGFNERGPQLEALEAFRFRFGTGAAD